MATKPDGSRQEKQSQTRVPREKPSQTVTPPILERRRSVKEDDVSAQLAGIIGSAMDAIITVGADQRVTLFNAAAEKMFRCTSAKAIGQMLDKFIPQRFRTAHRHHVEEFGRSGMSMRTMGAHQRVLAGLRADGEEFPIEASISQVEVGGEKLYTAIVRDVTARQQAQQALLEASSRFRTIFDFAPVGIMMVNRQGTILAANAALEKTLGYSDAEMRGLSHEKVTDPADLQATDEQTRSVEEGKTEHAELEKRYVRKDGERVWARVIISLVRDAQGQPQYFIKLIEDITERKRAEARARRARVRHEAVIVRVSRLTDREREVLWQMVDGKATKNIASELGASPKTIDVHRARVMEKMEADSVAQLVQMVMPVRKLLKA